MLVTHRYTYTWKLYMQEKAQHSRQWEGKDGIQEDYRRASTVSVMFYIVN